MQHMKKYTYMFIGAHPDDADIDFGGTAILLKRLGHNIVFVSVTDGSAGHQTMNRQMLSARRHAETQSVARFLDITYLVMDGVDGELMPDLAMRHKLIKQIRTHKPDVIVCPRPSDYHPDHRAAGQLVQDCSFLLTVPAVCPEVPRLERAPYIFYHQDNFTKPIPFTPEILVDITPAYDKKIESFSHHESQAFEWLPFIESIEESVPDDPIKRMNFLKHHRGFMSDSSQFISLFNNPAVQQVEALERCEYGAKTTKKIAEQLFPFAVVRLK
jgi:LmbE family N-acetylglucosaminyl deacetylase